LKFSHLVRVGLLACGALGGPSIQAQTAPSNPPGPPAAASVRADHAAVVDPATPVPALVYRSVFADLPAGVENSEVDWRRANDDVGQFRRGHVDILKWESEHKGKH